MHETIQERAGRDDQRAARVSRAIFQREPDDTPMLDENSSRLPENPVDVFLALQRLEHPTPVLLLVCLRARRPHSRATTAIENFELNAGRVDGTSHQAAQRIDLGDEMSFRRAANRGIAGHVRDGVRRQRADRNVPPETRRSIRRFAARVPGTDHDHVKRFSHPGLYFNAETQRRRVLVSKANDLCVFASLR